MPKKTTLNVGDRFNPKFTKQFAFYIPEPLFNDTTVSNTAKMMYAVFIRFAAKYGGQKCFAHRASLEKQLGISKSGVRRALEELRNKGYIKTVPRPSGFSDDVYFLVTQEFMDKWIENGSFTLEEEGATSEPCIDNQGSPTDHNGSLADHIGPPVSTLKKNIKKKSKKKSARVQDSKISQSLFIPRARKKDEGIATFRGLMATTNLYLKGNLNHDLFCEQYARGNSHAPKRLQTRINAALDEIGGPIKDAAEHLLKVIQAYTTEALKYEGTDNWRFIPYLSPWLDKYLFMDPKDWFAPLKPKTPEHKKNMQKHEDNQGKVIVKFKTKDGFKEIA